MTRKKITLSEAAAMGGKARAAKLSPAERASQARSAGIASGLARRANAARLAALEALQPHQTPTPQETER